nr:TBC1 domain family member 14-like [Penaeus vannamei]
MSRLLERGQHFWARRLHLELCESSSITSNCVSLQSSPRTVPISKLHLRPLRPPPDTRRKSGLPNPSSCDKADLAPGQGASLGGSAVASRERPLDPIHARKGNAQEDRAAPRSGSRAPSLMLFVISDSAASLCNMRHTRQTTLTEHFWNRYTTENKSAKFTDHGTRKRQEAEVLEKMILTLSPSLRKYSMYSITGYRSQVLSFRERLFGWAKAGARRQEIGVSLPVDRASCLQKDGDSERNLFSWRHSKDGGSGSDGGGSGRGRGGAVRRRRRRRPCLRRRPRRPRRPRPLRGGGAWRIFSRPPLRPPRSPDLQARNCELEAGSAGLIMENRPTNLPAKTAYEQLKHRQEYQQMVSAARKKELKEAKERKKAQASQQRLEEQMAAAVTTWNVEILPKWDTMHIHKKCRELWWQGLPSCVRGKVWKLAIGNDLNITPQLYTIMVQRSVEKLVSLSECGSMASQEDMTSDCGDQEATIDLIRLDVSRTFPNLCIFQKGGPYHDPLHNILGAYACYRPDVGYVQGMSFLAATLLLNMDETDAFIAFSNLLNRPAHMAFFRVDQPVMCAYYNAFEELLAINLPHLAEHLRNIEVTPDLYILDWLLTVFSRPLPIDAAVRIWDVYLRDGEEFLLRAAIGILKLYETVLTNQECTATAAQFLTRLPEDLGADALFRAIASVRTSAHKRTFTQILQAHMDAAASHSV